MLVCTGKISVFTCQFSGPKKKLNMLWQVCVCFHSPSGEFLTHWCRHYNSLVCYIGVWSVHVAHLWGWEIHAKFRTEKLREADHLGDLCADGRILLGHILSTGSTKNNAGIIKLLDIRKWFKF
jgi:hypothetical protein